LLVAVHCKTESVVESDMDPGPPDVGTFADDGLTVNTPPDWVSVREPAVPDDGVAVTTADRDAAEGFA
jgi:hypothetical protein